MNPADDLVEQVLARHRKGLRLLPDGAPILGLDAAYAVQDAAVARLGQPVAGFKVGLVTPESQAANGLDQPVMGVVLGDRLFQSGAILQAADFSPAAIEGEMAVRIARPLLPTAEDSDEALDMVSSCISHVAAAFEVLAGPGGELNRPDVASAVAANSWTSALVLGAAAPIQGLGALCGFTGVLESRGQVVAEGSSSTIMGDPRRSVLWLAQSLARRGLQLEPGHWISTGGITAGWSVQPGEQYRFTLSGLAPVELRFA